MGNFHSCFDNEFDMSKSFKQHVSIPYYVGFFLLQPCGNRIRARNYQKFVHGVVFTSTPLLLFSLCWQKIILSPDSGPEEKELIDRTLPLETNNNLVSSTEKVYSPDPSLTDVAHSNGNAPDCPIDSRVRDHTNNRIGESLVG